MNKKTLVILVVVFIFGALAYLLVSRDNAESNSTTYPTASTDPADYRKCVEDGGEVAEIMAPSRCVIGEKVYYDGNF